MKKLLALFATILILNGCSVPVKKVPTSTTTKVTVAVAVALPNHLDIQTIGTTIFNNKSMRGKVSGTPLPSRIRTLADNAITSSNKTKLIRSNGALNTPISSVKRNAWTGKFQFKNRDTLIQKARSMGADYLLLIAGDSQQERFYGTSGYISNIGVAQRSVFGMKRATSFAMLQMFVIDTRTSATISEKGIFLQHPRAGKPWISPQRLPSPAEVDEIISQLKIGEGLNKGLSEMGLL